MAKKRKILLEEYGISDYKYMELLYFCKQYREKKALLDHYGFVKAARVDTPNIKTGNMCDKTAEMAFQRIRLERDVKMVEDAAIQADPLLADKIIANVVDEIPYEYLGAPCGRRQFYVRRKLFFVALNKIKTAAEKV